MIGKKFDTDKNRLEILFCHFAKTLWGVGKCCTYGANKYDEDVDTRNWANVENPKPRYIGALFRHLMQHLMDEKIDKESGLPHLHQAIWNLLVLSELESEE